LTDDSFWTLIVLYAQEIIHVQVYVVLVFDYFRLSLLLVQNNIGFAVSAIQLNEQADRKHFRASDQQDKSVQVMR
jgi:hypothetical protein